MLTTAIPDNAL